jgi:hypothetical protein
LSSRALTLGEELAGSSWAQRHDSEKVVFEGKGECESGRTELCTSGGKERGMEAAEEEEEDEEGRDVGRPLKDEDRIRVSA